MIPRASNQVNPLRNPKHILSQYGIAPKKYLGQNFLVNQNVLYKIMNAANVTHNDTVLEIGPGLGILTQALAQKARRIVAVEKDREMVAWLHGFMVNVKNVEVVLADALKWEPDYKLKTLAGQTTNYKLIANLPYYITSPIIRKFLEQVKNKPQFLVLMVQKEVAQRICAKPPCMNLLAVSTQFYGKPEIVSYVNKASFWPQPKVDSAIIKITPIDADINANARGFFTIVRAGFKQPRKQLASNLTKSLHLPKEKIEAWLKQNNIKPNQRAETLAVQDWINLANSLK